ncbi:aminoglycoside phosphotransferase [Flavobacterium frigoris]|uniref:5-methylthioribose kinase n=1 Tax=Flavobacterium frigoris TaxID=229204 RepID=A0A1H9QQ28_FLAFI|nr:aminoglycoside phosphotransferase [Flavobacterium frigoris]SER62517.1 5-methylthioribose kinase [Flavobacterium frigoris]
MFILNASEPKELAAYLHQQKWLKEDETVVAISKPGDGNMNCVLRIEMATRSFIIKQSRGYVEKYPQVLAPANRVLTEGAFYEKIAAVQEVQEIMPKLLGIDAMNNLIALEDLGKSNDFTVLYDLKQKIEEEELRQLVNYLNGLHQSFQKTVVDDELENTEMRKLNYEHIFEYPFREENGFDLDAVQEGLQAVAMSYKKDSELKQKIERLGSLYLSKGKYLLQGDYYPGSWLKTAEGIKVIDPEFCFYGLREFDLGVFLAHMYLTQQKESTIAYIKENYYSFEELNTTILNGFIGAEIMRRLIGLAQLPLKMELKTKATLLTFARDLILK